MAARVEGHADLRGLTRLGEREAGDVRIAGAFASTRSGMHRIDAVLLLGDHVAVRTNQLNINMPAGLQKMLFGAPGDIQLIGSFLGMRADDAAGIAVNCFNRQGAVFLGKEGTE